MYLYLNRKMSTLVKLVEKKNFQKNLDKYLKEPFKNSNYKYFKIAGLPSN